MLAQRLQDEGVQFDFAFSSDLDRASEVSRVVGLSMGDPFG